MDALLPFHGALAALTPGWAVALPEPFAAALRAGRPAVIGRLERGRCLLDLRCVEEAEDGALIGAVRAAARDLAAPGSAVGSATGSAAAPGADPAATGAAR